MATDIIARGIAAGVVSQVSADRQAVSEDRVAVETAKTEVLNVAESIPEDYSTLSADVSELKEDLVEFIDSINITRNAIGRYTIQYAIAEGTSYRIKNDTSRKLTVSFRSTETGSDLQSIEVLAGNTAFITAADDATYLSMFFNGTGTVHFANYSNSILHSIESLNNTTNGYALQMSISGIGNQKFDAWLEPGIEYTYTNGTSSNQSLNLYRADGTSQVIAVELNAGASTTFVCAEKFVKIGGYFNAAGTATITSSGLSAYEIKAKAYSFEEMAWEQGAIDITGAKVVNTARLRTISKLYGSFDITLPSTFKIYNIIYYNSDGTFDSVVQPKNRYTYHVSEKTGKYVQFTIGKMDGSNLTVTDLKSNQTLEEIIKSANDYTAWINDSIFEQGSIYNTGAPAVSTESIRTKNYLHGAQTIEVPEGFALRKIMYYNADGSFYLQVEINRRTYVVTDTTRKFKVVISKDGSGTITPSDIQSNCTMEKIDNRVTLLESAPIVHFDISHDMPNTEEITKDLVGLSFTSTTIMEDIYDKFDALVTDYPDYVSKVDVAELLELEYPEYATYTTYLYKFIDSNTYPNGVQTRKRKMLLFSNLHGDEVAAPFAIWRNLKKLCEMSDINAMKLRASYDIYIVPVVNQYGSIHKTRTNGNGVDINRNFPTKSWNVSGVGTDRYSGAFAASEFETQFIIGLTEMYNPDLCIDFHNYASLDWQFYSESACSELLPISYQSLVDLSYAFIKNMPEYFGNAYHLFIDSTPAMPRTVQTSPYEPGRNTVWWTEEKGIPACTVEMSANINYLSGEINHQQNYTADAFSVGEKTQWVQLLRYAEYALENS